MTTIIPSHIAAKIKRDILHGEETLFARPVHGILANTTSARFIHQIHNLSAGFQCTLNKWTSLPTKVTF